MAKVKILDDNHRAGYHGKKGKVAFIMEADAYFNRNKIKDDQEVKDRMYDHISKMDEPINYHFGMSYNLAVEQLQTKL